MKIQHRHFEDRGHHYWEATITNNNVQFRIFIAGTPSVCDKQKRLFYIADFHRGDAKRMGFPELHVGTSDDVFLGKVKHVLISCKRIINGDISEVKGRGFVCFANAESI